jgi:hypothetical protein
MLVTELCCVAMKATASDVQQLLLLLLLPTLPSLRWQASMASTVVKRKFVGDYQRVGLYA